MTEISIKYIKEPCLVDGDWVEVEVSNNEVGLAELISQAEQKALQAHVNKVEIRVNYHELKFSQQLTKLAYKTGLVEFNKLNNNLTVDEGFLKQINIDQISIDQNIANTSQIKAILMDQANYHALLSPDYYLSGEQLDWHVYLNQLWLDINKSNGRCLFLSHKQQPIALIVGELIADVIYIWEFATGKKWRGKGYGTFLMDQYVKLYHTDCVGFSLETLPQAEIFQWYLHHGWTPTIQSWFKRIKC